MAKTQAFGKFFSKPNLWGPIGLFPPESPSIEVGGEAPHLNRWVSRRGEADWTPENRVLRKTSQWVGSLPGALLTLERDSGRATYALSQRRCWWDRR